MLRCHPRLLKCPRRLNLVIPTVEPPNIGLLGSAILSFVLFLEVKMNYCYRKGVQKSVLCWEVVPFPEGPLSEVPLYIQDILTERPFILDRVSMLTT